MLTITLAGLLAVVGALAVLAYARQANNRAVEGQSPEKVLAARIAIPAGTSLGAAWTNHELITVEVPAASLTASLAPVRSVTAANRHLVMRFDMTANQLLLGTMLGGSAAAAPSSTLKLANGMVAVTVQMCASEAVANYLTADSEVDVYGIYPVSKDVTMQRTCDLSHTALPKLASDAHLVLTNVKVLAVTHALPSGSTSSGSSLSAALANPVGVSLALDAVAVTFEVNPSQVDALIQVAEVDLPYLALVQPAH
jgi:pilus assembly protein CpaB